MGQSDLDLLIEMGFERPRAELAVKKSGGLQGALQWLEDNQDKPLEQLQAAASSAGKDQDDEDEAAIQAAVLEEGQSAKSLVCNECGKKFRSHDAATFHATKTQHTDFSESTDEIAPLTEEEKKARLEELRQKLKEKRATQSVQDREDAKRNEQIRQKATKETQDAKEELARKEQIKEAGRKRAEKLEDAEAKRRIRAKIEADKEERRRRAEEAKAAREGREPPPPRFEAQVAGPPAPPKSSSSASEARLRLQVPGVGNVQKTFAAEATLFEVAQSIESEHGVTVAKLEMTFPRKVFEGAMDFGKTLREAGLVPSAVLRVL